MNRIVMKVLTDEEDIFLRVGCFLLFLEQNKIQTLLRDTETVQVASRIRLYK